jgi:hypothetical protein
MKLLQFVSPGFLSLGFFAVGLSCMTLGTCSGATATAKLGAAASGEEPEVPQLAVDQELDVLLSAK